MPLWALGLLPKLKFLKSGKFWTFLLIAAAIVFVAVQGISFVQKYVDREVTIAKQELEIEKKKIQVDGLERQVEVLENNQKVIETVTKETRVIQEQQKIKANKIEDKIDEEVKKGNDTFAGSITAGVIDNL